MKIFHTSDWHLGNFPGPEIGGENARAIVIRETLEKLVFEVADENPDIVLVTGDLFHQAKTWCDRALGEVQSIYQILSACAAVGSVKAVVALRGTANHDGEKHFALLAELAQKEPKIHIADKDEIVAVDGLASIVCIPAFDKKSANSVTIEISDEADATTRNIFLSKILSEKILDGLQKADDKLSVVLTTHFAVKGCVNENGFSVTNDLLEPTIDPKTLRGYNLVCLGHIHKPQQVAKNAFYAGSPMQITFGDEGDKKGFYVHETLDGEHFSSEFIPLETADLRQFYTLKLDDNQLAEIISKNYDSKLLPANIEGKIVRVIYDCDADTAVNLNKALLEKAAIDAGAWHVESVTSEDIISKTNKNVINPVQTAPPLEALKDWLNNADSTVLQNIDTSACLTLAEPIIEKINAGISKNSSQKIGLFVPRKISVKNYRNYENAEFNYRDVNFCVVNGSNGAGKSSLFMDALFDVLFEIPRENDIKAWVSNRPKVRSGAIILEFESGGDIYKVTRTRTKSGKLTLDIALINPDNSETSMTLSNAKDTQELIEAIIGFDAFTLKSCGLIMQANYDAFLSASKTDRASVLCDLLGLGVYELLYDETAAELASVNRQTAQLNAELENLIGKSDETKTLEEIEISHDELKNLNARLAGYKKGFSDRLYALKILSSKIDTQNDVLSKLEKDLKQATSDCDILEKKLAEFDTATNKQAYDEYTKTQNKLAFFEAKTPAHTAMIESKKSTEKSLSDTEKDIETAEIEFNRAENIGSVENINRIENDVRSLEEVTNQKNELEKLQTKRNVLHAEFIATQSRFDAFVSSKNAAIKLLEETVKRLKNSGCVDFDNADCEFLKAAKSAPAEIAKLQSEIQIASEKFNAEVNEITRKSNECDASAAVIVAWLGNTNIPELNAHIAD